MRSQPCLVCSATRSCRRLPTRSARTTSPETSDGQLGLTALGLEAARNLAAVQPVLDPAQRAVRSPGVERPGLRAREPDQEAGCAGGGPRDLCLPRRARGSTSNDLTVERFNELVESRDDRTRQVEVLRVRKIASQNLHLYMPAQLLIYGNPGLRGGRAWFVHRRRSPACPRPRARRSRRRQKRLGIAVAPPEPRPTLAPELEEQRVPKRPSRNHQGGLGDQAQKGDDEPAEKAPTRVEDIAVRSVDVHEHPQLLAQSLNGAKKRLLIIAPWVKGGVVNTTFAALERRLRAGVEVHIGHGYGPDDRRSDDFALRKLNNLAARYES